MCRILSGFVALVVCACAWAQDGDNQNLKYYVAERLATLETYSADITTRMNWGVTTITTKGTVRGKGAMSESSTSLDIAGMKMADRVLVDAKGIRWEIRNVLGDLFVSTSEEGRGTMDGRSLDFGLWIGYGSEDLNPLRILETFKAGYDLDTFGTKIIEGTDCMVIGGVYREEYIKERRASSADTPEGKLSLDSLIHSFVYVRIYLGIDDAFPRKIEWITEDGKPTTTYTYSNVVLNQPIADSEFTYTPPAGTEIEDLDLVKSTPMVRLGQAAPAFDVIAFDGSDLSLANYEGKVVLIDFWARWCTPCLERMPEFIQLYQKYHAKDLEVIGISLDGDRTNVEAVLQENPGMQWPQFFDGNAWDSKIAALYGVEMMPFTVLISRDGTIIGLDLEGEKLENAIIKALGD